MFKKACGRSGASLEANGLFLPMCQQRAKMPLTLLSKNKSATAYRPTQQRKTRLVIDIDNV